MEPAAPPVNVTVMYIALTRPRLAAGVVRASGAAVQNREKPANIKV
jgi:hypothetical protein